MRLAEWTDRIRHSMWFIPTLCMIGAAVAALGLIWFSGEADADGSELPILFGAGVDGARAMLQAIATSIITVAGVIFSVTIVALQLTSTQFSPRVLRNFLGDRVNQVVLGTLMGTFTYTLLVLRSVKSEDSAASAFVPAFAVSGALLLTLISLGMVIYFIHHITVRIQVTSIVASVAQDTLRELANLAGWRERDDERDWDPAPADTPVTTPPSGAIPKDVLPSSHVLLPGAESGYLQLLDIKKLVSTARDANGRLRLLIAPGAWVQRGAPCATFEAGEGSAVDAEALTEALGEHLSVANERSLPQDPAYGIQELVDVAAKALSPSVNDPTTAITCIDRLVEVLTALGSEEDMPRAFTDRDGAIRLEVPYPGFDELVHLAFDPIRLYGATTPAVVIHLARGLSILRSLPASRHAVLREQARLLAQAASGIELDADRRRALDAVAPLTD